jgi:formate dehydrogenase maturation protein FdhE
MKDTLEKCCTFLFFFVILQTKYKGYYRYEACEVLDAGWNYVLLGCSRCEGTVGG